MTPTVWFILGFGLAALELLIPGVILIFFGVAAIMVSGLCYIGILPDTGMQLLVFAALSIALLVGMRKYLKGLFAGKESDDADQENDFIGQKVKVLEAFSANEEGTVEFKGASWSATSETSHKKGDTVLVIDRDNLTLKVKAF